MFKGNNEITSYKGERSETAIYRDGEMELEVRLEGANVWLTMDQMAMLFERNKSTISRHVRNIFEKGGTDIDSAVANFATTAADGKVYSVDHFDLKIISSVGRRARSQREASFRKWAVEMMEKRQTTSFSEENMGEMILYQPNDSLKLEVLMENETVWLNRNQIAVLFGRDVKTIGKHINNALKEELSGHTSVANFATHLPDGRIYQIEYYDLDVVLSVGYRVKSDRGIQFRKWSNCILKEHILKGYAIDRRFERIEHRMGEAERKIDFFVRTSIPPVQGVFFEGQIFDAYAFVSDLIRSAKSSVVIVDNYLDETVLLLLTKRQPDVSAEIYTKHVSEQFKTDISKHNSQYDPLKVNISNRSHDRFLIIDNSVYFIGSSLKDIGKKLFAFSKMETTGTEIIKGL